MGGKNSTVLEWWNEKSEATAHKMPVPISRIDILPG